MMMVRAFLAAALFTLGACASTQRALSYSVGYPDADVFVANQRFQIWVHERDATVLVQRGDPQPLGALLAQNATVYARDATLGPLWWGAAANAVLTPLGCYGTEVGTADQPQLREVKYACREPVDMRAEVAARQAAWRRGVHVDAPAE